MDTRVLGSNPAVTRIRIDIGITLHGFSVALAAQAEQYLRASLNKSYNKTVSFLARHHCHVPCSEPRPLSHGLAAARCAACC